MKSKILALLTLLQFLAYSQNEFLDPAQKLADLEAYPLRLTVRVVDEVGDPLEGAQVKLGFFNLKHNGEYRYFNGDSNLDGEFSAEFPSHASDSPIEVTKHGYYKSRKNYDGVYNDYLTARDKGRFEPWNPTVNVVLKKIGKPIPLHVRMFDNKSSYIFLPGYGVIFQFDVFEWDWLPPHGKGKIADWNLRLNKVEDSNGKTYREVGLELSNEDDGMKRIESFSGTESFLVRPRLAPEIEYSVKRLKHRSGEPTIVEDDIRVGLPRGYFFRLRTILNKDGTVKSGYFGMILSSDPVTSNPLFEIWSEENQINKKLTLGVSEIFINPTSLDNNLEWDRKINMYRGLKW
jgi:hypothetical protein